MGLRSHKNLSPEEFSIVLDKFKNCKVDTVKLEGISEPMMHPQFAECAKILKERFPEAFVIVATNLQYNIEKTAFFATLPYVDMVYLSIDGVDDIYENARPPAKYSTLLASLETIKNRCTTEELQKLHINFVCTDDNYKCLPEIYELQKKYNINSVRINLAQNWNEDESGACDFNSKLIEYLKPYKRDVKGVPGWKYSECFWPYEGLIVDVFGDVRQCIINTSQKPLMNIYKDNIERIFNESDHYKDTRKMLNSCTPTENCKNCDYNSLGKVLKEILDDCQERVVPRDYIDVTRAIYE
jgi:radical SAM protein with 4Fe4S-binding SPASM domain